ncbi:MAG: ATP-binding protein [Planctomycetes bacterium]|nr:ATP-binding protein [Planctomycetota bacterium]
MPPVLVMEESGYASDQLLSYITAAGFDRVSVSNPESLAKRQRDECSLLVLSSDSAGIESLLQSLPQQLQDVPIVAVVERPLDVSSKIALAAGVAGIVPRSSAETDLGRTVRTLLPSDSSTEVASPRILCFTIDNSPELIPLIVQQVQQRLDAWSLPDPLELVRVTVALSESLDNALYHGNLELSSDLRQGDGSAWREESLRRRSVAPFCDRRLRFQAEISDASARFMIRDEGPGFDLEILRDCTESENLERCSGRGLHLMRMYMDDVQYNTKRNEVVLVKHRFAR